MQGSENSHPIMVNLPLHLIFKTRVFTEGSHLMGMQGPKYPYASVMFDPLSANQILGEKRTHSTSWILYDHIDVDGIKSIKKNIG